MNTPVKSASLPAALGSLAACLAACLAGELPAQYGKSINQAAARAEKYEVVDAFPGQEPFDRPIHLDHDPADPDAYYVAEQYGRIFRIPRDGTKSERHLFLDWTEKTLSPKSAVKGHNEEGLLGFAFDPGFATNGFFYIFYSYKSGERISRRTEQPFPLREGVVARFSTTRNDGRFVADPSSESVVARFPQPYGNHNGGTIVFGPDRMLYIVLGDGGAANDPHGNGQKLDTLLGAILRIDVSHHATDAPYRIPKDNPFVDRPDAKGEIWAYGLRNPWRINFDAKTGDLWCADVGQNLWEEVNRIVKGGNYGWNKMEGNHPFPPTAEAVTEGMIAPIAEYHHRDGISITGGQVYRGGEMRELVGRYLYADYVSGRLWSVREDREGGAHEVTLLIRDAGDVASFAEGANGEVFLLRFDGNKISKLQPKAPSKSAKK